MKVPIGLWVVNDPYRISDYIHKAKKYDFIITEESSCVPFYKKELNIQSFHFPLAVNERNYYPIPKLKKRYDFSFIGNATPSRIAFFNSLLKKIKCDDFILIGKGWKDLSQYKKYINQIQLKLISPKEVCQIYNQSKIVLNLHRSSNDQNKNPYRLKALTPNNRTFDICATNSFQLISYREELGNYFELNKEIVAFDHVNDLAQKINHYNVHKELRETIAKNGYLRALREHTYKERVASLLNTLPIELKVIRSFK
ncbi:glycosyltransferase [Bacillus sp. JCM 19034]|uniref:CgeB family protein n=1 Tax=Bacillus sp. JCM 19034 TaxID=1481928 RepID=UPI0007830682|nr:glycosyltransferase [Bacillus sp. JCM 19034]